MAQIAQQDNLILEITGTLAAMNGTTKQKLIDCMKVEQLPMFVVSKEAGNKVNHG